MTVKSHSNDWFYLFFWQIPVHLDWFGWCTWDAFYTQVDPQGIKEGLQRYNKKVENLLYVGRNQFIYLIEFY